MNFKLGLRRLAIQFGSWGILLISVYFAGCEIKPASHGQDNELAILIDESLQGQVENLLVDQVCPVLMTPQPERRFTPIFGGIDQLDKMQTQQFLLIVGTLDGQGGVSQLIQRALSPEVAAGVTSGEFFIFEKEDEWARGQLMMFLVAPDVPILKERLANEGAGIFALYNEQREKLVFDKLYRSYEQKDLAEEIEEGYGIKLRIPHDYVIVREELEEGWLRLKRPAPDRYVTLWRSAPMESNPIDSAWAQQAWLDLAAQYADPSVFNPDYLEISAVDISNHAGLELRGLWETIGPQGGGPFFCRLFYNTSDQRVYLLNAQVYNPGAEKEPYIKQLEVIAETFGVPGDESSY